MNASNGIQSTTAFGPRQRLRRYSSSNGEIFGGRESVGARACEGAAVLPEISIF